MIELTLEQMQAVATNGDIPPRLIDPTTHTKYVLLREEIYDRVKRIFAADEDDQFVREMTPHVMEIFGREGWDDPAMDGYNELDPRVSP